MKLHSIPGALAAFFLFAAPGLSQPGAPAGALRFAPLSFEVAEEAGMAVITVERFGGQAGEVSVHYTTGDDSAVAGADYLATAGNLTWAHGEAGGKTFTVPILDDGAREGGETVRLALATPTGDAAIDPGYGKATLLIRASDGGGGSPVAATGGEESGPAGLLRFDQRDFPALEQAGVALISVERAGGTQGAVSVQYAAADGTATAAADYTATSGTLTWDAGEGGLKSFKVPLRDDGVDEPIETFRLSLSNATGGAALSTLAQTAVVTIGEDEARAAQPGNAQGVFRFQSEENPVIEGRGPARILVQRAGGRGGAVSVSYSLADSSATAGQDYTAVTGTLSWAAREGGTKVIEVPIQNDAASEGNERALVRLSSPTGGAILDAEHSISTLLLLDDDGQTTPCLDDDDTLCLAGGRFQVEVVWRTLEGDSGVGHVTPISDVSGTVSFFNPENVEVLIKVLDVCDAFQTFWVFFAATTDVSYTVTVTDTATGVVREYKNASGQPAEPVQDTGTFATCSP